MRKNLVIFLACALVCATPVYAQSVLHVNIPFEFTAGSGTLPAGEYHLKTENPGMVVIYGLEGQGMVFAQGLLTSRTTIAEVITKWQPGAASGSPNVSNRKNKGESSSSMNVAVFHKYGEKYFLREVWTGHRGHYVYKGKSERSYQSAALSKPERIELAALAR